MFFLPPIEARHSGACYGPPEVMGGVIFKNRDQARACFAQIAGGAGASRTKRRAIRLPSHPRASDAYHLSDAAPLRRPHCELASVVLAAAADAANVAIIL
jgi:hypothetical protein